MVETALELLLLVGGIIKSKLSPAGQSADQIGVDVLSAVQKAVKLYEQHTGSPIDPSSLHAEPLAS